MNNIEKLGSLVIGGVVVAITLANLHLAKQITLLQEDCLKETNMRITATKLLNDRVDLAMGLIALNSKNVTNNETTINVKVLKSDTKELRLQKKILKELIRVAPSSYRGPKLK